MRAAATGTDYINLISSSLTVSTDLPLPPLRNYSPLRALSPLLPAYEAQSYVKRAYANINVKFMPRLEARQRFDTFFNFSSHLQTKRRGIYTRVDFAGEEGRTSLSQKFERKAEGIKLA